MEEKSIIKVTNSNYICQQIWPLIVEFADILKTPGMSANSILEYFLRGINTVIELWGAIKDARCIGFINFQIATAPYYSMGLCPFIYMQEKDEQLVEQFYEKFLDFLNRHNLKYCMYHSQHMKLGEHFKKKLANLGIQTVKTEYIHIARKKVGGK